MPTKRAILYARVSSERQAERDLSIPSQLREMRRFCQEQSWSVIAEITDEAESGRFRDRPGIQEVLKRARNREFDLLLVWKLSRFARNARDALNIEYELKEHDVELVSVSEPIDDTPMGESFRHMMHVVNQMYSLQLAEDTLRGMTENARRGYWNGSWCPMGYCLQEVTDDRGNRKRRLAVDPQHAPIVQRIFEMYIDGAGLKSIVNTLNSEGLVTNRDKPFNKTLVRGVLGNEVYIGVYAWGKKRPVRIEDNHEAIITQEDFQRVQMLLQQKEKPMHSRRIKSRYALSGLVRCAYCGLAMVGRSAKSGQYLYYACQRYSKIGKHACEGSQVSRDKLEAEVTDVLREELSDEAHLRKLLDTANELMRQRANDYETQIANWKRQLRDVEKRIQNIYEAIETASLDASLITERLKELQEQRTVLQSRIEDAGQSEQECQPVEYTDEDIRNHIRNLNELLVNGDFEERKAFLRGFVKEIRVWNDRIEVDYTVPK